MNKNEYLYILRKNIQSLQSDEIDEIIDDVASHFDFGLAEGKSEEDVAKELGDPELMARQFIPHSRPNQSQQQPKSEPIYIESTLGKILRFLVYCFIAITVLPGIFGVYAAFIAMIAVGFALILSGFAVMFSPIFMAIVPGLIYNPLSIGSSLIASIGVILIGIALIWIFWALIKLLTTFLSFAYKRMFGVGGTL